MLSERRHKARALATNSVNFKLKEFKKYYKESRSLRKVTVFNFNLKVF